MPFGSAMNCRPSKVDGGIVIRVARWNLWVWCLVLAVGSAGCGAPTQSPVGTARGRVLYHGQPLSGGMIVFAPHPDKSPKLPVLIAELNAAGEFKLTTSGSPYLPAGWYRVAIADPAGCTRMADEPGPRMTAISPFPDALRQPDRSGLERQIVAGRENEFDFAIQTTR